MYAVVRISGYQCLVKEGDVITVPRQAAEPGTGVAADVLFLRTDDRAIVGRPSVPGASVETKVVEHVRADKVMTYKFIRRETYRRKKGHRQQLTRLKVSKIALA
jgi:large subunit ribosomal protein L21